VKSERKYLWCILVPTQMDREGTLCNIRKRFHQVWDAKVRAITGGLTIHLPAKGNWISLDGELFEERMIPVQIYCTEQQINDIADLSAKFYNQLAIMYWVVSRKVRIRHYDKTGKHAKTT